LWLPILVSAVLVFVASSVIHMALKYHSSDFAPVPNEDDVMEALRRFNLRPGDYLMPRPGSAAAMNTPEYKAKREKGPVMVMTVLPSGMTGMGKQLGLWFVYSAVVALFAGYVAGIAYGPGTAYMPVFRMVGTVAFAGFALGQLPQAIWYGKSWSATFKGVFDGLVYALLTGGAFGWLWPSA
jgi:hypothetical protein